MVLVGKFEFFIYLYILKKWEFAIPLFYHAKTH